MDPPAVRDVTAHGGNRGFVSGTGTGTGSGSGSGTRTGSGSGSGTISGSSSLPTANGGTLPTAPSSLSLSSLVMTDMEDVERRASARLAVRQQVKIHRVTLTQRLN